MSDQVWTVAVTPAQRLILLNLSHAEGQKLQGQRARSFRRFMRAFGVDAISAAASKHPRGQVSGKLATSTTPALHTITAENADYALGLGDVERHPLAEVVIGPLFDALDDLKAGRECAAPEGAPAYDPASEDWTATTPPPEPAELDVAEKIAAYLRAANETHAAELVDRGGWDKPTPAPSPPAPPAPNGESHPAS